MTTAHPSPAGEETQPSRSGKAGKSVRNPESDLDLRAGELVEVRSEAEIEATLDARSTHRGLRFLDEMRPFCGRRYRVFKPVRRIQIESTGELRRIRNTVLLEGVLCDGSRHGGCDRSCFFYWREVWLKRVEETAEGSPGLPPPR